MQQPAAEPHSQVNGDLEVIAMKHTLGIIGGAGVAATNTLLELMEVAKLQDGAFRDMHHPEMIILQATQAPSRSMFLEGRGASYIEAYLEAIQKVRSAGATKIAMCCNTAHWGISTLEQKSGMPFINVIYEVLMLVKKTGKKNIGLLASDGCLKGRVYEQYFEKLLPDATLLYPSDQLQHEITRGICNIKNKSRLLPEDHPDRPRNIFTRVTEKMFDSGADLLIIGCTDIRVDFKCAHTAIDSLEVLAQCILRDSENEQ